LSTLHTNDAPGAIARLTDMGIEPFLISSSLLMACAQRLVRKICPHCKETFQVPPEVLQRLGLTPDDPANKIFYRGRGCGRCKDTGFLGRIALLEVLPLTNTLKEQILRNAGASVIKEQALKEGMKTLRMAGIEKAKAGATTIDEIMRITGTEE
jgi:type II secretory ATPase GspE/PulE/Tfp pilus assembly ATPase PilB-like protein